MYDVFIGEFQSLILKSVSIVRFCQQTSNEYTRLIADFGRRPNVYTRTTLVRSVRGRRAFVAGEIGN